jgi:putative ATP-dependent endonuclease of the OLD family
MGIRRILIENFRSIKHANMDVSAFNIFVGQNNHGKTNLFEAIEWLYEGGPKKGQDLASLVFCKDTTQEMFVEVEFDGASKGAERMKNAANKTKMLDVLGGKNVIAVRRSTNEPKKRTVIIDGKRIDKLPTGFDAAFNDFLPRLEYVDTQKCFDDVAKYSKGTPVAIMLSGVLATILENSAQYRTFQDKFNELFGSDTSDVKIELDKLSKKVKVYLEKQFPDCSKVSFTVTPPVFEDLLKNFDTSVDDGIETSAAEKGDGMQRALMLSILQAYSDFRREHDDIGKSFLFFIDEAELHLHPTAQRNLKNVLLNISSQGDQVFINTHSSVLVVDEGEGQSIFKVEKIERETNFTVVDKSEKANIVYDLLGGTPADLLLPRNFLIVEGKTEQILLTKLISKFYADRPEIQIIQANGDAVQAERSINAVEQVFKPIEKSLYKDKVVILLDQPRKQETLDGFLSNHCDLRTGGQVFPLSTSSIEEYYPNKNGWRKTASEVARMTTHQKVTLAKKVSENISQADFESEMPIVFNCLSKCWANAF